MVVKVKFRMSDMLIIIIVFLDTYQGDSGGPLLMFTSENVWEQVGITSSGYGCARPNYPGIYTLVAAFQSWISETFNTANNIHISTYRFLIHRILWIVFIILIVYSLRSSLSTFLNV